MLASLSETPLFLGATLLTALNDNALITYLATLVPDLGAPLKLAVVAGCSHRWWSDGDSERAESGGAGPAESIL